MSAHSPMQSVKNNFRQLRKISYFEKRGKTIRIDMRTGKPVSNPLLTYKKPFELSQERKTLMFKKGIQTGLILAICFALIAYLTVAILSATILS